MEEIIAKSKKMKYERQHEKEQVTELTERVDAEWKQLRYVTTSRCYGHGADGARRRRVETAQVRHDVTL